MWKTLKANLPPDYKDFIYIALIMLMIALPELRYGSFSYPRWLLVLVGVPILIFLFKQTRKSTFPALLALAIYIPFGNVLPGTLGGALKGLNLTNMLFLIILVGWLYPAREKRAVYQRVPGDLLLWLFIILTLTSLVHGGEILKVYYDAFPRREYFEFVLDIISRLKRFLDPVILFYLFSQNLVKPDQIRKIVITVGLGIFVAALVPLKQYYIDLGTSSSWDDARVSGIFTVNELGAFMAFYLFVFAGFLTDSKHKLRYLMLIPILTVFRALMVSFSRGALLGFGISALLFSFTRSRLLFWVLIFALAVGAVFPNYLPESLKGRFKGVTDGVFKKKKSKYQEVFKGPEFEGYDDSAKNRILVQEGGFNMIKENPLRGLGYGTFGIKIHRYVEMTGKSFDAEKFAYIDAHNMWLLVAAEMGLPTLLILWLVFAVFFINALEVYQRSTDAFIKSLAIGYLGILSSVFACNFFGDRFTNTEIIGYFWLLSGIVMRIAAEMYKGNQIKVYPD